ncbi:hypothetical protein BWZ20_12400 [Winogradskyella sp. J14-2]|uniref:divalent cation tolerance protein CutA n=1 Tax=Winogradskyella sp. J14-2 TaxID=1936080 RepID=UPI000972E376|nr:divalent cation tolerance protein CutA [Winogradskyella sp. J14-2]APY09052.1 hypothetical protein BWZ20_12400 [Winogradskyella sp. J14-2]
MIQINIITKDREQAEEITTLLFEERLVVNEFIINDMTGRNPNERGNLTSEKEVLIVGTTKALLFNAIDQLLQLKYGEHMPIIYAIPIVYINSEQSDYLRQNTAKV